MSLLDLVISVDTATPVSPARSPVRSPSCCPFRPNGAVCAGARIDPGVRPRLCRQAEPGNWNEVALQVAAESAKLTSELLCVGKSVNVALQYKRPGSVLMVEPSQSGMALVQRISAGWNWGYREH